MEDKKKVRENIVNFLSQLKKFGISTISYKEKKIENKLEKLGSWEFIVPRGMELEITNNCNFHCKHCYNHSGEGENLLELSKEETASFFKEIFELGTRTLEITGGEPSTHHSFNDILEEAMSYDFEIIGILSNGSNFSETTFEILKKNKEKVMVQIDLHGSSHKYMEWFTGHTQSYQLAMKTIERLTNLGIVVRIACSVTPQNVTQMKEIATIGYNLGAAAVAFGPIAPIGRAKDRNDLILSYNEKAYNTFISNMEELIKKYGSSFINVIDAQAQASTNCGVGSTGLVIASNLDVRLCQMSDVIIGNIKSYNGSIKNLLRNNAKVLEKISQTPAPNFDICRECEDFWFCSSCMARGFIKAKERGENCKWIQQIKTL